MKRGAGADIFLKTLEKVRAAVPGIALRTSFIVGFPGESLRDFELLEEFIGEAKFDWLGVFNYSDEEGSGAFSLDAKVPKRTIEARKRRLMKLQQSISKRAKQQWVGRELVLLAEGESEETPLLWEGRTQFHAPEIDGKVYINDFGDLETLEPGRFYKAEITEAHDYDVVARALVSGPAVSWNRHDGLPRKNPQNSSAAPPAACWSASTTRTSRSAATAAARSISANGPRASTRSARPFSTPKSSKTWADSAAAANSERE